MNALLHFTAYTQDECGNTLKENAARRLANNNRVSPFRGLADSARVSRCLSHAPRIGRRKAINF